jgi:hypothetical protein
VTQEPIAVAYVDQERRQELRDIEAFDALCRDLLRRSEEQVPLIITIEEVHGRCIYLGLHRDRGFVHVTPVPDSPPYIITVGDPHAESSTDFFLHGQHHTEIRDRHLIPAPQACRAARDFILTGEPTRELQWEEV